METQNFRVRGNRVAANTDRIYSPNVWYDCPIGQHLLGEIDSVMDGDDFHFMDTEDAVDTGGYQKYIDTGNTIRLVAKTAALYGGYVQLITDATDNDGPAISRIGANAATSILGPFFIGNGNASNGPVWFECRLKLASVSDDVSAWAIGLGPIGAAADNGLLDDNAGDIVDSVSFIGFRAKHVNSGTAGQNAAIDFVYQDAANTAPTVAAAAIATNVADTFIKLGFKYSPSEINSKQIKLYVNNVEYSTYVTKANIDASTFPENKVLNFVASVKNGSGAASTLTLDWWRCFQSYGI